MSLSQIQQDHTLYIPALRKKTEKTYSSGEDIDATKTSKILGLNGNTIDKYFTLFREIIYLDRIEKFKEKIGGKIEVDESYFGAKRKRGITRKLKRGRGTLKQPVSDLLKEKMKVEE